MPTLAVDDPAAISALAHPVRAAIVAAMRTPTTAAEAGRLTGQSRQNAAYHVGELAKAGILRHAGERRNGNFVEQLYVAVAETIVISPRITWGNDTRRLEAMADQLSLGQLVAIGERLQQDAATLLDRAAFDDEEVASASASTEIRFANEADRASFLRDYIDSLTALAARYGADVGDHYRVVLAAHPLLEDQ